MFSPLNLKMANAYMKIHTFVHLQHLTKWCTYTNTHKTQVSDAWVLGLACLDGGRGWGRSCLTAACVYVHLWEWPAYLHTLHSNSIPPPPPALSHPSTLQSCSWAALSPAIWSMDLQLFTFPLLPLLRRCFLGLGSCTGPQRVFLKC